ncbi:MAG: polysaccharide deacetylase family protein [Thermodesulfobacteriota bacterium]
MNGDLILCYHRVAAPRRDPQLLAVSPERFAAQMEHLAGCYRPASLDEIAATPGRGGRVAVTFDDGYADNLHLAAPILEQYGIPATVYVVADNATTGRAFWWDELDSLLLGPTGADLPPVLELPGNGAPIRAALPRPGVGSPYAGTAEGWSVLSQGNPGPGHHAYRTLYPQLLALDPQGREQALAALRNLAGPGDPDPETRPLAPAEVAQLDARPGLAVGAHTLRHPVLSALPEAEQEREIADGAARLAAMAGRPATHFSYPYGSAGQFTDQTVDLVRQAGFATAVTTIKGLAGAGIDPLRLPRHLVRDWDAATFAARLKEWMP